MKRETTHVVEVGIPVGTMAVEATAVAGIPDVRRVQIVTSPGVRTAAEGVVPVAALVVPEAEIAGDAMRAHNRAEVLQVATAADGVDGIEGCRVATVGRFSLRSKLSKARTKVCWNCIVAATDLCAIRRRTMRPKIPIRLSRVHWWKNTSSARVC